jgi:hypothetical protein
MQDTLTLQHWANKGRKIRGIADQTLTRRNSRMISPTPLKYRSGSCPRYADIFFPEESPKAVNKSFVLFATKKFQ